MLSMDNKATYILRWNSAQSRLLTMSSFESTMRKFDFNLNYFFIGIMNWQNIHKGDIVYMIREGEGNTGIVMRGTIFTEPLTFQDLCTEKSRHRIIDIKMNQIMHPDKAVLPDSKKIEERWNHEEWKGLRYLIPVDKQTAEELEQIFNNYLLENKEQFAVNKNNGIAITDFDIN